MKRFVEASLKSLGYTYTTNQARGVTEFEVSSPREFRIVVEEGVIGSASLPFFRGTPRSGCVVEVRRTLDSDPDDQEVRGKVAAWLEDLVARLPREPWEGFGFIRSRTERTRWKELSQV